MAAITPQIISPGHGHNVGLRVLIVVRGRASSGGPGNTAPYVEITSPLHLANLTAGVPIQFQAIAIDTEDGDLTGTSVVWTSNIDGQLGTGTSFQTTLSEGTHTITCVATDSGGKSGRDTITVSVSAASSETPWDGTLAAFRDFSAPYPTSNTLLTYTPPLGIDQYGNGTTFDVFGDFPATADQRVPEPTSWIFASDYGNDLQTALNALAAATGRVGLVLENSTAHIYTGNVILPINQDAPNWKWVVSRAAYERMTGQSTAFPAPRIGFGLVRDVPLMATIQGPTHNSLSMEPVLKVEQSSSGTASYYAFRGINIRTNPDANYIKHSSVGGGNYECYFIVDLDNQQAPTIDQAAHHLWFHQCRVATGHWAQKTRDCFKANCSWFAVTHSTLIQQHSTNDGGAVLAWQNAERLRITENIIIGSGMNILFGGVDPTEKYRLDGRGLVPSDIEFRRNTSWKPLRWNANSPKFKGIAWHEKNAWEAKNAQRWLMEGCVHVNNWLKGQQTGAFLFQSVTDNGSNGRFTQNRDIQIRHVWLDRTDRFLTTGSRPAYDNNSPPKVVNVEPPDVIKVDRAEVYEPGMRLRFSIPSGGNGVTGWQNDALVLERLDAYRYRVALTLSGSFHNNNGDTRIGTYTLDPPMRQEFSNILVTNMKSVQSADSSSLYGIQIGPDLQGVTLRNVTILREAGSMKGGGMFTLPTGGLQKNTDVVIEDNVFESGNDSYPIFRSGGLMGIAALHANAESPEEVSYRGNVWVDWNTRSWTSSDTNSGQNSVYQGATREAALGAAGLDAAALPAFCTFVEGAAGADDGVNGARPGVDMHKLMARLSGVIPPDANFNDMDTSLELAVGQLYETDLN